MRVSKVLLLEMSGQMFSGDESDHYELNSMGKYNQSSFFDFYLIKNRYLHCI